MKRLIKTDDFEPIKITMYLYPLIYSDSEAVTGSVSFNKKEHRYHTDINPSRMINGPLSGYKQELENPIKEEYDSFIDDCVWLIKEVGFTILKQERSTNSEKSEYIVIFGMDDEPCFTLIYELRISDHPFSAKFPEEWKDEIVEKLNMEWVLDGTLHKEGIDFAIDKITVGAKKDDTWDKAFQRLYDTLAKIRRRIRARLNERKTAIRS